MSMLSNFQAYSLTHFQTFEVQGGRTLSSASASLTPEKRIAVLMERQAAMQAYYGQLEEIRNRSSVLPSGFDRHQEHVRRYLQNLEKTIEMLELLSSS